MNHKKMLHHYNTIAVINSGSSSIKVSIFICQNELTLFSHREIKNISELKKFFRTFDHSSSPMILKAVGHRVVHGGKYFFHPTLVSKEAMKQMQSLIPLAPLHQPRNLEIIKMVKDFYPKLPQVACFDTSFHRTQEKLAKLFAIPKKLTQQGLIRYGFHGISYEYISSIITQHIGSAGNRRVIVAHLGNGASMCAMHKRKSVATTMGFSTLDGLMMGTRCGRIDPGILLYLMQEKQYCVKQLEHLLYDESGLLGVSNISSDMRTLLSSRNIQAKESIELFCYRAALEFGSLIAALNGCDALIFTAGIGENTPIIREKICKRLAWAGIQVDLNANKKNSTIISAKNSNIIVGVIPTNEEYMIAKHTWNILDPAVKPRDDTKLPNNILLRAHKGNKIL